MCKCKGMLTLSRGTKWRKRRGQPSILRKSFCTIMCLSVRDKDNEVMLAPAEPPPHLLLCFGSLEILCLVNTNNGIQRHSNAVTTGIIQRNEKRILIKTFTYRRHGSKILAAEIQLRIDHFSHREDWKHALLSMTTSYL